MVFAFSSSCPEVHHHIAQQHNMGQSHHSIACLRCYIWARSEFSFKKKKIHTICDFLHLSAPAEVFLPLTTAQETLPQCKLLTEWGFGHSWTLALISLYGSRNRSTYSHLLPTTHLNLYLFPQPAPPCSSHVSNSSAQACPWHVPGMAARRGKVQRQLWVLLCYHGRTSIPYLRTWCEAKLSSWRASKRIMF